MDKEAVSERTKILLVEDDKDQAYVLQHFLETSGYSVRWCDSIETALSVSHDVPLDLILLDIMIKDDEDGFKLCKQIREDPSLGKIPIIMVTARTSVEDRIIGLQLGADDYVTKPFRKDELVARIEAILRRKKYSETNERYRELMENINDFVIFLDTDGRIEQVNKKAEKILSTMRGGGIGLMLEDVFQKEISDDVRKSIDQVCQGNEVTRRPWQLRDSGQPVTIVEAELSPIKQANRCVGIGCLLRDITEQEKAQKAYRRDKIALRKEVKVTSEKLSEVQEQLIMAEKMAVIGQLAAGIAHELRNPLNIIGTSAYYLQRVIQSDDSKIQSHIGIILQEIQRAQKIINNLLDFSRKSTEGRRSTDVNEILRQTFTIVEKELLMNDIAVDMQLGELDRCYVNADEMKQVFINLILNAKNAMPRGGTLAIRSQMNGANSVLLTFRDSGVGIPTDLRNKIFDPFFTTRRDGKGTGLGLSIVHASVKRNHGRISFESEEGKGTTFILELPTTPE